MIEKNQSTYSHIVNHKYLPHILAGIYFIIIAIISFKYHKIGDYGLETDFFYRYVPNANTFLEGSIAIDGFQGPLYPMILGVFKTITGDYMIAGQLINIISVSAFLLCITIVFRKIFSSEIAIITFLLTASNKHIIQNTYSCGTDMLFLGLLGGLIYFLLRSKEYDLKNIIITGVFAGLAFLTRFNGLFMVLGVIFSYTIINIYGTELKRRLIASGIVLALFFGIYSPYGLHTLSEKDSFLYNTNYKNVAWTYQAQEKVTWDEFWHEDWCGKNNINSIGDVVFYDFGGFVSKYITTLQSNLTEDFNQLINWTIGIGSFIGLLTYILYFPKEDRRELSFIVLSLIFWGVLGLVFYNPRFSMFLVPFYTALALRFSIIPRFIDKLSAIKFTPIIAGLILFILSVKEAKSYNKDKISSGPKEMLKLQKWFKRNEPTPKKGETMFSRKPHPAYYTGTESRMFPVVKSWQEFLDKIEEHNVKYVYYSYFEYSHRPQLRVLVEPKKVPPVLKLIHVQSIPGQPKQVPGFLYRVEK